MKTTLFLPAVLLAVAVAGSSALAQDNSGAVSPQASAAVAAPTPVNGVVYVDKLPTPTQLTKDAEAEGLSIIRMDQTADRMLVVYKYPNGSTRSFAYMTAVSETPASMPAPAPVPTTSAPTYTVVSAPPEAPNTVVYSTPAPTVVYTQPGPVVYYNSGYSTYYDPWGFWGPLAIGVGLGWGFHGGYYHGHGWHDHGHGWHH